MKKILIIHNQYRELGGEDIAVNNEVEILKKHFNVEKLYFTNNIEIEKYFSQFMSFMRNKNMESSKVVENKLISFNSKTKQNKKDKYVQLEFNEEKNNYDINGSSFKGSASIDNVIGNWWSHKILQTNSQISPISGSIKEQVVTFIGKEKIELYGKIYEVERFKLTSKDMTIPKDKRLNFDIWFDKKNALIIKVAYSRMGNWEYRIKKFE